MMVVNNLLSGVLIGGYLVMSLWLVRMGVGRWFGMDVVGGGGELVVVLEFLGRYLCVWRDVFGFVVCGCVG